MKKDEIMLQSLKKLYGDKLDAADGEIGHVKDFYFDDQNWTVRYVVVDTGTWLTSRQVLLPPHVFEGHHQAGKILLVNLTRIQIEASPSIESHKPVSRQYEEEYHNYYGWPYYWEGEVLPGMNTFPVLEPPLELQPDDQAVAINPQRKRPDTHLQSTQSVTGYHIQGSDGIIGHVSDFMVDDGSWTLQQIVIKTGHRFSGKEVQISVSNIDRISYEESTVFVNLTKATIEQSPAPHLAPVGAADN